MNSLIQYLRQQSPDDPRTDEQLLLMAGQQYPQVLSQFPDAQADYNAMQARFADENKPNVAEEFGRGAERGYYGLKATGEGAAGLGAALFGAKDTAKSLLQDAQGNEEEAARNAPSVENISDIKSVGDFMHWLSGQAGELAPNIAEMGLTSAIGAAVGGAAGTAAEPGGGTVVGAGGGALAGIVEKSAVKSIISNRVKAAMESLMETGVSREAAKIAAEDSIADTAIGKFATGQITRDALDTDTAKQISDASSAVAKTWGNHVLQGINFSAQSAGQIYNDLTKKKDVDPDTAINTALFGGFVAGVPGSMLPSYITDKFVGGVAAARGVSAEAENAVKNKFYSYLSKVGAEAAKTIPGGVATMDMQTFVTMAAEKYAQGQTDWTDDDWKQLANASAVGGVMGATGALAAGLAPTEPKKVDPIIQNIADAEAEQKAKANQPAPATKLVNELSTTNPDQPITRTGLQPEAEAGAAVSDNNSDTGIGTPASLGATGPTTETSTDVVQPATGKREEPAPAPTQTSHTPTPEEAKSGDYPKEKVKVDGLTIAVENTPGSVRSGVGPDGKPWQVVMPATYGEIEGSKGADGDKVDAYLGNTVNNTVYVIDQKNPQTGAFDEHKALINFASKQEAIDTYNKAFSDGSGPSRIQGVSEMPKAAFEEWVKSKRTKEPLTPESPAPAPEPPPSRDSLAEERAATPAPTETPAEPTPTPAPETKPVRTKEQVSKELAEQYLKLGEGATDDETINKIKSLEQEQKALEPQPAKRGRKAKPVESVKQLDVSKNTIVTDEQAARLREMLAASHPARKAGMGSFITPEFHAALIGLGVYHLERGARTLAAFSKSFISEIPEHMREEVMPRIKEFYDAARARIGLANKVDVTRLIDFDNSTLTKEESAKGTHRPAYWKVRGDMADVWEGGKVNLDKVKELGEALTADSRSESGKDSRSVTRRLTVFERADGAVVALPTWKDQKGEYRVGALPGEKDGQALKFLLGRHDNGEPNYTPVASIRVTPEAAAKMGKNYSESYHDLRDFNDAIGRAAEQTLEDRRSSAQAFMHAQGIEGFKPKREGAEVEEPEPNDVAEAKPATDKKVDDEEEQPEGEEPKAAKETETEVGTGGEGGRIAEGAAASADEPLTADERIDTPERTAKGEIATPHAQFVYPVDEQKAAQLRNLTPPEVETLWHAMSAVDWNAPDTYKELADAIAEGGSDLVSLVTKIARQRTGFFDRLVENGPEKTFAEYGLERPSGAEKPAVGDNPGVPRTAEPTPVAQEAGSRPDASGTVGVGQDNTQGNAQGSPDRAGQSRQEGVGGNKVADNADQSVRQSKPSAPAIEQNLDAAGKSKFTAAVRNLSRAGMSVELAQATARELAEGLRGQYKADAERKAVVYLKDVTNPTNEDFRATLEEGFHDLVAQLPSADRQRVLDAAKRLSDADLNIDRYTRSSNANIQAEERLAMAVSKHLEQSGFDPIKADNFASHVVRVVKDLYLRAAMAVQRAFLGEGFENPELAKRWIQNRFEGVLAGDSNRFGSFLYALGGGKLPRAHEADLHIPNLRDLSQRIENGVVTFDHIPLDSVAAVKLSVPDEAPMRFSLPQGTPDPVIERDNRSRTPELEAHAARLNLQNDIVGELVDHPDIKALAQERKLKPEELIFSATRMADPKKALEGLSSAKEADGSTVKFNKHQTLEGIAPEIRDEARIAAYSDLQRIHSRVTGRRAADAEALNELTSKRDKQSEALDKAHDRAMDATAVASDAHKSIRDNLKGLFEPTSEETVMSRRRGIQEQLQQLDPDATLRQRQYQEAKKSIIETGELKGDKLFSLLDAVAKDTDIDLNNPIADIREAMENKPQFSDLTEDSARGRLMLSSVVQFAKSHRVTMVNLEMRSNPERARIVKGLETLKTEKATAMKGVKDVARSATLQERANAAYREERSKLGSLNKRIAELTTRVKVADAADGIFQKHLDNLSADLGLGSDFIFRDKAQYIVPDKPNATSKELREKGATNTVNLDASGKITNPADIEQHIIKQTNFINARDRDFEAGDKTAHDDVYHTVKRMRDELTQHKNFSQDVRQAQRTGMGLVVSPEGKKLADAIGTPSSKSFERRINRFTAIEEQGHENSFAHGQKTIQLENKLLDLLPKTLASSRDFLRDNILRLAKGTLEKAHDLAQAYPGPENRTKLENAAFDRVKKELLSNPQLNRYIGKNIDPFVRGLKNLLEHEHQTGQWEVGRIADEGMGVQDKRLMVKNPVTGQLEPGIRRHVAVGPYTFPRSISNTFSVMLHAMRKVGWRVSGDEFKNIAELHEKAAAGDEAAKAKLASIEQRYFHPEDAAAADQVKRVFMDELTNTETESVFNSPHENQPADINLVQQAWQESKGDVVKFAERLHELHGGDEEGRSAYVGDVFNRLSDVYKQIDGLIPTEDSTGPQTLRGSFSDALINARTINDLPASWFDYRTMDEKDLSRTNQRIAAQVAFGRSGEAGQAEIDTMRREVTDARMKLKAATDAITAAHPEWKPKQVRAELQKKFGTQLKTLERMADGEKLLKSAESGLHDFFAKDNGPYATVRFWTRAAHLLGGIMVSKPSSAIIQLAKLTDLNVNYGASPSMLAGTAKLLGNTARELAASLMQAAGMDMKLKDEYEQRFANGPYADSGRVQSFRASLAQIGNESASARAFRAISEVHELGLGKRGGEAKHTVFRPLSPFTWVNKVIDRETTLALWRMVDSRVAQGVEYFKAHPESLNDPSFKLTADHLGLSNIEKDGFNKLTGDLSRWYLDYNDMARDAAKRDDGQMLTDKHLALLQGLARSEVANEGNLSTMSTSVYNNSVLNFAAPLITWGFRRMMQIAALPRDNEGRISMKRLGYGVAGLAVASAGGLALSGLLDEYYKDIIGKQRNLQPELTPQGALENLNRIGTFGLMGELADSVLSVGEGGDNRMLSLDRRIVAVSSMMSLYRAAQAFVNQDMDADYVHVVRPIVSSLGGASALEYMQIANHALGTDIGGEGRVVARINAQNYLRVVGRELDLDVRTMDGGYNTPTPVTPFLTKMELAAYANDPSGFQQAYQAAVQKAKENGHEDPVDYVKRAFASRNPLRSVFRTPPSEQEYQQLLNTLPTDGRRDVSEAVRLVNSYGERIGVKAFDGSNKKEKLKSMYSKSSTEDFKTRAALAIGGY